MHSSAPSQERRQVIGGVSMVQSSEHQKLEGLRCFEQQELRVVGPLFGWAEWMVPCSGLLLELDPELGLGRRCGKKECRTFHPILKLIQNAVEQGMLTREEINKILDQSEQLEGWYRITPTT